MPLNPQCMSRLQAHIGTNVVNKPPLSFYTIGGGTFVIQAKDKKTVRISELAHLYPASFTHCLLTPEGPREVCIQIGKFCTNGITQKFRDANGNPYSFVTNMNFIRLDAQRCYTLRDPAVFNGMRIENGEQTHEHHLTFEKTFENSIEHYIYTMTPGPIYLGAGKHPIFLPFEVTDYDIRSRQSPESGI